MGLPAYQSFPQQSLQSIATGPYAYLYTEYNDDQDLQAFISAFNSMTQDYLTWFNTINLPVYAGNPLLVGPLLDWVLTGLYGIPRPTLPSTTSAALGVFNTIPYDTYPYLKYKASEAIQVFVTSDDVYKRIATWNLYKGDGQTFTIAWLKRRIQRFLDGNDGQDGFNGAGVSQTYAVSVEFQGNYTVGITVTGSQYTALWAILKAAISGGACQMPFQYTYSLV